MKEGEREGTVLIGARVPQSLADRLDELASMARTTRSAVIRVLIENATTADLIPASLKECAEPSTEVPA